MAEIMLTDKARLATGRGVPGWMVSPAILTAVGLVIVWELGIRFFGVPAYIAPPPSLIVAEIYKQRAIIMASLMPTAVEAVVGFLVGNMFAISLATWLVHRPLAERSVYPIAVFIHTIPTLAIAPILVLILGTGYAPKIAISAMITFFPMLVNMVRGLKSVTPQMMELMTVLSASRSEIFWKVRWQSSWPFLFAALKVTAPASVIGAVVGEWIGSSYGLGALILAATYNFRSALLYAAIVSCSALALIMTGLVSMLERRVMRWNAAG